MNTPVNPSIVFRFKKDMRFPKFGMAAGDKWLIRGGSKPAKINALPDDGEFEFAGGMCRKNDVETLYFGHDETKAIEIFEEVFI